MIIIGYAQCTTCQRGRIPVVKRESDGAELYQLHSVLNGTGPLVGGPCRASVTVVDKHLVVGAGGKVSVFGDPADFNNGVGNAGVRILSWREVR